MSNDKRLPIHITAREFYAILTGLRLLQSEMIRVEEGKGEVSWPEDILSRDGEVTPLTPDEITVLCEQLNVGRRDRA